MKLNNPNLSNCYNANCETCKNREITDSGDSYCWGCNNAPILIIDTYEHTDNYLICKGVNYERDR